jgi:hypothetical protein
VIETNRTQEETRRPLGTLACLKMGFEVVARNPALILTPLLVDLFLWLGPRLSIAPIVRAVRVFVNQWVLTDLSSPEVSEAAATIDQVLSEVARTFDLFSALRPAPLVGVPVLMPYRVTTDQPFGVRPEMLVHSVGGMMGWTLLLMAVGLALTALYLQGVGRRVIDETEAPLPGPKSPPAVWIQFLKLGALLLALLIVFSTGFSFVLTLVGMVSMAVAGILMTLAFSSVLFIGVHLIFAVPGIVQLRRGPLRAIRESLILARSDFMNVLLLLGLVLLISQGLNVVWSLPDPGSWSTAVGLAGHAFVSTGLTAALFIFYQERLNFLRILKQAATAQTRAQHDAQPS